MTLCNANPARNHSPRSLLTTEVQSRSYVRTIPTVPGSHRMTGVKPSCCLDTSAFNALLDDPEREAIISAILSAYRVLITSIAMVEVLATPNQERRWALLGLMKAISDDTRPLAMPNKLLNRATKAFAQNRPSLNLTITHEDERFWLILQNPTQAGDSARAKAIEWNKSLESSFADAHVKARPDFQELFANDPSSRPRNIVGLFRYFQYHDQGIYDLVRGHYRKVTGRFLARSAMWHLFARVPDWPLSLAGWAHEMFARAISETNYGRRGKPGNMDLWSAGYLPYCDVFVTNDTGGSAGNGRGGQYRALRLLNYLVPQTELKPFRARVLTFQRLKADLLHR
jgi:hypothetical protein